MRATYFFRRVIVDGNLIFLTPILAYLLYLLTYTAYEFGLNISDTFIVSKSIVSEIKFDPIQESIFRAGWGISLIITSVINSCLFIYCLYVLLALKNNHKFRKYILGILFIFGALLWVYIRKSDLGGGVAGVVYDQINTFKLNVNYKDVIDITSANGYVAIYLVSILLSNLCFEARGSDLRSVKVYLRRYKTLLFLTSAFMSASILQLFLQYQWFSVFLSKDLGLKLVTFGYPLIISVFYVGMFSVLFLPTAEIFKHLTLSASNDPSSEIFDKNRKEFFPDQGGIYSVFDKIKSFTLFVSPILTVIIAEAAKNINFG